MEGKKTKIAIIGGGNMGGAITMALSKKEEYEVFLYERTMEKAKALLGECPITLLSSISEAVDMDCVIIALKPQNLPSFYHKLHEPLRRGPATRPRRNASRPDTASGKSR